jgi:hypothetical protein
MMLGPYIRLLHQTESLRNLSTWRQSSRVAACACTNPRPLKVACVFFESMYRNLQPYDD